MTFDKRKGKIFRVNLNRQEQDALNKEMRRQLLEYTNQNQIDLDSAILYTLHTEFGFGKKRLKRFYNAVSKQFNDLTAYYQMPEDFPFLCERKLRDIGVDVREWNQDVSNTSVTLHK